MVGTLYLAPAIAAESEIPNTLLIRALAMVEGKQIDSAGKTTNYTPELLQQITDASNALLANGTRIPLFIDHEYSQKTQIGVIPGPFVLGEVTAEDLPHPGMEDLIGKQAIFTQVQLSGQENCQQYYDGLIKTISIGRDPGGKFCGVKNAIYEISAVPFPAVRGASLYSKGEEEMPDEDTPATYGVQKVLKMHGLEVGVTHQKDDMQDGRMMPCAHGHIRGHVDETGQALRAFVDEDNMNIKKVYRVKEMVGDDDSKNARSIYLLGFKTKDEAKNAYIQACGPEKLQKITYSTLGAIATHKKKDAVMPDPTTMGRYMFSLNDWLKEEMVEAKQQEYTWRLWQAFQEVLEDINEADAIDLKGKTPQQAIADLCDELAAQLKQIYGGVAASQESYTQPTPTPPEEPEPMPEPTNQNSRSSTVEDMDARLQLETLQAQFDAMQAKTEKLERDRQLTTKFQKQQRRAELLRGAGKMPPAMYKAVFGTGDEDPVELYSAHTETDPVEFLIDMLDKYGTKIPLGRMAIDPVPTHPDDEEGEKPEDEAKSFFSRNPVATLID